MKAFLLGRKIGMTQVYNEQGVLFGVTVLSMGPCQVLQVKTKEADGYDALQLGFEDKPRKGAIRSETGHVKKVGAEPKRFIREQRLDAPADKKAGEILTIEVFEATPRVDVIGMMKGRGFTGAMKRHGFSGLEKTHGVQMKHRAAGSIGANTSPGRVIKGRRMPGRHGASRSTVRNLDVVRVDKENNLLLVRGGVPGPNGGLVMVRQTNKLGQPKPVEPGKEGKKAGKKPAGK